MKVKNSLGNRLLAFALSIVMVLGMVSTGTFAVEDADIYATVEKLTDGVTFDATGKDVKATFAGELTWVAKDDSVGRYEDGWWVGLKVIAPETVDVEKAKYIYGSQERNFKDYNDSADDADVQYITFWSLIKEEFLRSANQTDGLSTYTWKFDWDGNGEYEQTMTLDIDADQTVLYKDSAKVYPADPVGLGTAAGITSGASVSTNGANTTITYSDITLEWSEKNPAVGRNQDGWWVGIQITAPAQLTKEADFANVTYQSYGADGWSVAKSFWDAQDSDKNVEDTARFLTIWGLVTPELIEKDNDGVLTYQYRFDWNQDGIYEQELTLKINATTVKLMKDGIQQLPLQFGVAESLTGGTVTGSETANSVITYEDITLTWVEANPAVGRGQDGWWVGAKITAPADMTTQDICGNVKYQRYENGAWSEAKSFWAAQDSDKNAADTARYLTMWCLVTPELIANDNDGILTLQYRFDWNQDGEYEQQLTLKVVASKVTLLNETGVQVYPALGVVTPLTNGTVTGSATGETTVLIENVALSWSEKNEEIGRNQDGWWAGIKVTAPAGADFDNIKYQRKTATGWTDPMAYAPDGGTKDTMQLWGLVTADYLDQFIGYGRNMNYTWQFDWNGDGTPDQTVTMSVDPKTITLKQAGFDFANDTDTVTYGDNNNEYTILAPTGGQAGTLTYDISDPAVATLNDDGTLTILKAGTVVITATLSGEHYENITASYTLTVEKADQTGFGIENAPSQIVWQEEALDALTLVNGKGTGDVTWTITEGKNVATVSADGKITLQKAGTFTLQVQQAGDDCYNDSAVVAVEIKVLPKTQEGFDFAQATDSITYNDVDKNATEGGIINQYTLLTSGGQAKNADGKDTGAVYSIEEGDCATLSNGVLTITKAGTITIKAYRKGNEQYADSEPVYFTLTVEKDEQDYTLAGTVNLTYGTLERTNAVVAGAHVSGNKPVYTISDNTIGASILEEDKNTGKVTFGDSTGEVGKAIVTVIVAGDDCYKEFTASYELNVSYLDKNIVPAPITDGKSVNDSWYTGDVVIKAPDGYTIAYDNKLSTEFESEIPFVEEGVNTATVYLKNEDGYITDAITVADIKLDTADPYEVTITYEQPMWEKVLEGITFGIYKADTLQVKLSAKDATSGIASLTYVAGDVTETIEFNGENAVSAFFNINAQYRNQITLTATDVSGRTYTTTTEKVLVLDTKDPNLKNVVYEYMSGQHGEDNGIFYTQGDVKITFTIEETNFDLSDAPIFSVDNAEKVLDWTQDQTTGNWTASYTLEGSGDYTVKLAFTDIATNEMVAYKQEIHIDEKAPELTVEFDNNTALNTNNYDADRNATITIKEHNFKAEDVIVTVVAKDILGNPVEVQVNNNWISVEDDVHTLVLPFTVDAIYSFRVDYTDLSGRAADGYETAFVLDKTTPTDVDITYSTPVAGNGIYKDKAVVTITAKDVTSGVDYFVLTYTKTPGSSSINKETFTVELPAIQSNTDASIFTATYTLEHEADGTFSVELFDKAGNKIGKTDTKRIVVDKKDPTLEVTYAYASGDHKEENGIFYTQDDVTVKFFINEANFALAEKPVVTVNGVAEEVDWAATETEDVWVGQVSRSAAGDYKVQVTFTDASTNAMETYTQEFRIDDADPIIEVSYDNNSALNENCYKDDRIATITIKEHNFNSQYVNMKVDARDIMGKPVDVEDYLAFAKDPGNWDSEGDVHTLIVPFTKDAIYNVTVECTDQAGNSSTNIQSEFVVDHTGASNIQITYSTPVFERILETLTFGFYKAEVVVTVTAEDITSGVDYFELTYTRDEKATDAHTDDFMQTLVAQPGKDAKTFTASYTVPAQARGSFSVKVFDRAGNDSAADDHNTVIVTDTEESKIKIEYTELEYENGFRDANDNIVAPTDAVKFYYNKAVTAKITIEEANFFEGKTGANNEDIIHQVILKVTKTDDNGVVTVTEYLCEGAQQRVEGAAKEIITWTTEGDVHTTSITIAEDGDYVLELSYQDFSKNDAAINGTDGNTGNVDYTSRTITVDKTKPIIEVSYDNNSALNENCYKDNRTATITVTEHNFKPEEFVVDVTTKDLLGDIEVMDYAAYAQDPENWTHDGNVHTLKVPFEADAIYTFDVSYTDMAGNAADDFAEDTFVVDHTGASNIQITYSTPVFERILETLTFGFYKAEVVVTVTAEDVTSGVDYFELTYTRDEKATDAHTDDFMQTLVAQPGKDAKTFTASYTVPAQARGSFSVKVFDRAGNDTKTDDHGTVIVTDTVSPEITVDFAAKKPSTKVHFVNGKVKDVETFAEATNAFFNGDVVATITVNEANFFEGLKAGADSDEIVHEIIIKVTKTDDNGVKTVTEYLPSGAAQTVADAKTKAIQWTTDGDVHATSITFANDGDYVLEITYSDFSKNASAIVGNDGSTAKKTYTSKIITVDETAPVIDVAYGNTDVINTVDKIKYFDKIQTAVITVTEHNFRAEDIAAAITAKNVVGDDVDVADFAAQLANKKNWKHEGNVHTAEIKYTVDANYTFDIDFVDLAQNASADYKQDLFTVDTTAPKNLTVSYSTRFFEQIKESITFGYYNAKMTVTITAEDDTSGIYHFAYSYIKGQDVSGINAELLDQAIKAADITYDGKKATATFDIPKMVLGNDNQFNGTVEFTAFDRSEVSTELKDTDVIVVDNIAPTAKITYNAPIQTANGISYYNGNINATIVINEANFDAKDVVVSVTKNGAAFPVNVTWTDESVDTHIGTFTLTSDGDYIVSVQYADKSGNQMTTYTSNQLTLDATNPTIEVSNIKVNSANKDEKYGFVITINDTNLDPSTLKPVLKAVVQKENGVYEIVEIDLGNARTVITGQTYTYTVEDLPDDGLYTLSCEVQDMSANGMSQVILDDGASYEQVQFSINRKGSAFGYGNKFTEDLVEQYYIYSVNEDVVIVEVNVDPVEEYKLTLNGKDLVEGTDYTTTQTSKDGEWSKRTYTIKKALFEAEGEYNIIVTSVDKTETTAFSDVKNLSVAFVVDQTKPVLTITGMETGGRYRTEAQTVTLIPTDEGGKLSSLMVLVMDSDGNPLKDKETGEDISVRFNKSGEELLQYLKDNDGMVTFTIPDGLNNQVKIICTDCATSAEGQTNEYNELFDKVTVSPNQFVIFYANTPLFVGTIVGVLAVIGLIIFLIKRKKNKKGKAESK